MTAKKTTAPPHSISAICVAKKSFQGRNLNLYRQNGEVSYICIPVV